MEKEQSQQIQISLDPNVYGISNTSIIFNEEDFHFVITSGNQARQFIASPKHAKRIYLLLKQQIENYEKQFGQLKTELPNRPQATQENASKLGF